MGIQDVKEEELETLKGELTAIYKNGLKELNERIASRNRMEKFRDAKATFPQDQKFIDTIKLNKSNIFHFEYDCECCCDCGCEACFEVEMDKRYNFEAELDFEIGFSAEDIVKVI